MVKNLSIMCFGLGEEYKDIREYIGQNGRVFECSTIKDCLPEHKNFHYDILIINEDIGIEGICEFVRSCKEVNRHIKIILFTKEESAKSVLDRIKAGVDNVLLSPVSFEDFKQLCIDCIESTLDPLCKLYTKDKLLEILKDGKNRVAMMLDIDNLSHFNNAYGLSFGDEVIRQSALFLDEYKPNNTEVFRLVGDVFVVLFENDDIKSAEEFATIVNVLLYEAPLDVDGLEMNISFTIGIAQGSSNSVLRDAQNALNDAKEFGKKLYSIYNGDSKSETIQKHNIEWMQKIKEALESNNVVPYFQPIIDNKTGKVDKYECLARINHKDGHISPGIFLESAKMTGLLPNISLSIINKSFKAFKNTSFEFSINASAEDLKTNMMVNYLMNRCDMYEIDPSRVVIEVLETIGSQKSSVITRHLNELKEFGFKIAIDDFGTDNSNFSRIFYIEPDYIKIDGSFIKNIHTDSNSYKIANAITSFSKSINAKVVAEFVHCKEVQDVVMELGIDYSQGYYFGAPTAEIG